jgi:hypothetical protein
VDKLNLLLEACNRVYDCCGMPLFHGLGMRCDDFTAIIGVCPIMTNGTVVADSSLLLPRGALEHLVEPVEHALVVKRSRRAFAVAAGSLGCGEAHQPLWRVNSC